MVRKSEEDAERLTEEMIIQHQQPLAETKRFYDKILLLMAFGAMMLSMAYALEVMEGGAPRSMNCVRWAWYCFAACVVLQLVAIGYLSFFCVSFDLGVLDTLHLLDPRKHSKKGRKWPVGGRSIARVSSFTAFVLGLVLFGVFVLRNLPPAAAP